MFCKYCGASVSDSASFCPKCGKSLRNDKKNFVLKKNDIYELIVKYLEKFSIIFKKYREKLINKTLNFFLKHNIDKTKEFYSLMKNKISNTKIKSVSLKILGGLTLAILIIIASVHLSIYFSRHSGYASLFYADSSFCRVKIENCRELKRLPKGKYIISIGKKIDNEDLEQFLKEFYDIYWHTDVVLSEFKLDLSSQNKLTTIENEFSGYPFLTGIYLPNSITSIGKEAFAGCSSLACINIPKSVTSIGVSAFSKCSSLIDIKIPESVSYIGAYAFKECSSLTSINLPQSITAIENGTFLGCSSLPGVKIPESVSYIGESAFDGCKALIVINIPEAVTSIERLVFNFCVSLTAVKIPDSVTSIGFSAFGDCHKLSKINIPASVTYIGDWAFCNCGRITSITIPEGITEIREMTFGGCSSLRSIKIPDSVSYIGESAFEGCKSLTEIIIPSSVIAIHDSAFSKCKSLASINIPASVTYIGSWAFEYCEKLKKIYLPMYCRTYRDTFEHVEIKVIHYALFEGGEKEIYMLDDSENLELNELVKNTAEHIDFNILVYIGHNMSKEYVDDIFYKWFDGNNDGSILYFLNLKEDGPHNYMTTFGNASKLYYDHRESILSVLKDFFSNSNGPIDKNVIKNAVHLFLNELDSYSSSVKEINDEQSDVIKPSVEVSIIPYTRDLKLQERPRMTGDDVKQLQERLIILGYLDEGENDGYFGPKTEKALKEWEGKNGFAQDGIMTQNVFNGLFGL